MENENRSPTGATKISFSEDARKELFEGLKIAAQAVGCTMGPRGKTVLIQREGEAPLVTKDGVTVSRSIRLKDPLRRMGAELIREAASRTNDVAGDGTTTATVLTHALVAEGLKLAAAGHSALGLRRGIELGVQRVIEHLRSSAKVLSTREEIAQVATISANGDAVIGDLIARAMDAVGKDGIITVEDAKGMTTALDVVEGMQFDRGYLSPYFVTNQDKMHALYHDARILVTDKKISSVKELIPVLESVHKAQGALLIIAEDVEGEALQGLVLNRLKSNLKVVAIKAPGYGSFRDDLLRDICKLTGAKLVSASTGTTLEKSGDEVLGKCAKFVVDAKSTTIVGTGATKAAIEEHVATLRSQLADVTLTVDDVTRLKTRIAKLASGVAIVKVGGATEIEMIERKYRIEDALNATRAAAEEGIVPGGGMALVRAGMECSFDDASEDTARGLRIVKSACDAPLKQILENCGKSPSAIIGCYIKDGAKDGQICGYDAGGYDAANDRFCDMYEAGIIDPVKVTTRALEHAASVACTFLSLDAVISEDV